jgi:hypothetical protein
MEVIDNNVNNLYIIKRRLADLKLQSGGHYEYVVGEFLVKIFAHRVQEQPKSNIKLAACEKVDVVLQEKKKKQDQYYDHVYVGSDSRFINYTPIQYEGYNHYDLNNMPLINLCELIRYLHKLSKLAVFV